MLLDGKLNIIKCILRVHILTLSKFRVNLKEQTYDNQEN